MPFAPRRRLATSIIVISLHYPDNMTAIFDMDGLLLDTEPLWGKSMLKIARQYDVPVKEDFFKYTTGLRIYEVTDFWKHKFPWPGKISSREMADEILEDIIAESKKHATILPGVIDCLEWLKRKDIAIGVATSSPMHMLNELIDHFGLLPYFKVLTSADTALFGKPHPDVYLQCAHALNQAPWNCVAFEDSVNGMISAKAARMKVVVVPHTAKFNDKEFGLADVKLRSLTFFNEVVWDVLK